MSVLKTYDRPTDALTGERQPWPFYIIDDTGQIQTKDEEGNGILGPDHAIAPGCWVSMQTGGGFGFVVAINDDNLTVLWSEEPKVIGGFTNIAFPIVRRVFAPLVAQQLVSIQPMSAPTGAIFYMDYKYGDPFDSRCNEGPWWRKMFWRAWRCTSGKTRSCWWSLRDWWRSLSSKKSTSTVPDEPLQIDRQRELLTTLLQDPDRARKLVDKWQGALTRSGRTGEPSEEDGPCP